MINITQVSKFFGNVVALQNVNLEIPAGGAAIFQGPSGSGKSTLLRLIAGLEIPDAGQIILHGLRASSAEYILPPHKRQVGMLFQTNALWPHMNVFQNIAFGLKGSAGADIAHQVQLMLADMHIPDLGKRFPGQLSGGQARRVALARTLITKPKILLLDEPLININPDLKADLLAMLLDYAQSNDTTMLYVTHDPQESERIAGDQYTIIQGEIYAA